MSFNNLSSSLYNTLTHPGTMRVLLANFFQDSKSQAIGLLQQSGVNISSSAPMKAVRIAWLQAIKDSASFRTAAAATLTQYIYSKSSNPTNAPVTPASSNFVTQPFFNMLDHPSAVRYLNDSGDDEDGSGIDLNAFPAPSTPTFGGVTTTPVDTSGGISDTGDGSYAPIAALQPVGLASVTDMTYIDPAAAAPNQIRVVNTAPGTGGISGPIDVAASTGAAAPSGAVAPASAASSGSFWSTLGSIFTPATVQAGVATGLGAYSTQLTAAANQSAAQSALQLEAEKLQAASLAANQGFFTTPVIIGLVSLAVIGIVVAVAMKSKNKASASAASSAATGQQAGFKQMKAA